MPNISQIRKYFREFLKNFRGISNKNLFSRNSLEIFHIKSPNWRTWGNSSLLLPENDVLMLIMIFMMLKIKPLMLMMIIMMMMIMLLMLIMILMMMMIMLLMLMIIL